MAKDTTQTPMQYLFGRLRRRKEEVENEITRLQSEFDALQLLENDLLEKHLELEPFLNFYADERSRTEETQEPLEDPAEEQQDVQQRHKLPEAICHLLSGPDPEMTHLTVPEMASLLDDMRQRGELDTKAERITYDRTSKVVRGLVEKNALTREAIKVNNRTAYVYRLTKKKRRWPTRNRQADHLGLDSSSSKRVILKLTFRPSLRTIGASMLGQPLPRNGRIFRGGRRLQVARTDHGAHL